MSNENVSNGIGFFSLLGIVFIVLKLIGVINWSWWVIIITILMPLLFAILIIIFFIILKVIFPKISKR